MPQSYSDLESKISLHSGCLMANPAEESSGMTLTRTGAAGRTGTVGTSVFINSSRRFLVERATDAEYSAIEP